MLIQFSVANYLSFKEQAILSMAATSLREPSSLNEEVLFHLEGTDISVVESSVILGANASGKSNLVKALDFFKKFVAGSFKSLQAGDDIGVDSFRLNNATVSLPLFCVYTHFYRTLRCDFLICLQILVKICR